MRRSICYCEPHLARAGDKGTWKFIYTTATALPKGARLKFDLLSKGKEIDWEIPQISSRVKSNLIYAYADSEEILYAKSIDVPHEYAPQFEFTLAKPLKAGSNFTIVLGPPPKTNPKEAKELGNAAQTLIQRRRHFLLYVDPKATGNYGDPEVFTLDIKGNKLEKIRIISPSFTMKNKRFDIVIRFEDEFGNLTGYAPEGTLIELTYEHLRENLNWKLFVPETGFVTLPNFYFNELGSYKIKLHNLKTSEIHYSSPIKCFAQDPGHLLWGTLHGESERFDSLGNVESCLRNIRDEEAYNFYGVSSFNSIEETPNDDWKIISQNITEFNETDRFITFLGNQWFGEVGSEALRQFLFLKDNKAIIRKKEAKFNSLKKIYKAFNSNELISIPSFTMGKGFEFDFSSHNPEYEPVVEIYNAWGSSECTAKEGNAFPIKPSGKTGVKESPSGSILAALKKNCRFGFIAGGLDDRGIFTDFFDKDQEQYFPGLTGILAEEYTRESLFEALKKRSCYATTGVKILLGFNISGNKMGSEISTQEKPGLFVNRHITGFVMGSSNISLIEIIRCGEVLHTLSPNEEAFEFTYDDMVKLDKVSINAKDGKPPFVFYYLRITQEDGHMAWSSPIWIDYVIASKAPRSKSDGNNNK